MHCVAAWAGWPVAAELQLEMGLLMPCVTCCALPLCLQNAAHGTYSALAAVPNTSAAAAAPTPPPAATATGYARLNPPHQPQLTPAQQAAQAAITASEPSGWKGWLTL